MAEAAELQEVAVDEGDVFHEVDEEVNFRLPRMDAVGPPPPGPADEMLRQFTALLQQAANRAVQNDPPRRERTVKYKVPEFDGTGDVELYIAQFQEVAELEEWGARSTILKAREGLSGKARLCGQYETWEAVAASLRLHFGLTTVDAGIQLNSLRRSPNQSLAEYGLEIRRLVSIAYEDAPPALRQRLEIERFKISLNHPGLQGHLLARAPETIEEAVTVGSEYLQLLKRSAPHVREVEETKPTEKVAAVSTSDMAKTLEECRKQLSNLWSEMKSIKENSRRSQRSTDSSQTANSRGEGCWGCHSDGHIRRDCPTNPWPQPASGNGKSPRE